MAALAKGTPVAPVPEQSLITSVRDDVVNDRGLGELAERMAKEKGTDFYTEIMELDLEQLRGCDAIYMLTDWQDSPGAIREHSEADRIQIAVWYESINN